MSDIRISESASLNQPAATVAARLPEFWPKLGLGSTLRPVFGVAGRFVVVPPDFIPAVPVPMEIQVTAESAGSSRVEAIVTLPGNIFDDLPLVNKVPFGRGKKMVANAIGSTLRLVQTACVANLDCYLNDIAGRPGNPVALSGTPMTFSSGPGQTFALPLDYVSRELPALWAELPVAVTLAPTATPGRFAVVSGRYSPVPVAGYVELAADGPDRTAVSFEVTLTVPLSEVPWFVPRGVITAKLHEGFAAGLGQALQQCEAMLIQRRTIPPPGNDGLAA